MRGMTSMRCGFPGFSFYPVEARALPAVYFRYTLNAARIPIIEKIVQSIV